MTDSSTKSNNSAWQSAAGRRVALVVAVMSFILMLVIGTLVTQKEEKLRQTNLENVAQMLASTALSAGGEADDILLKVNDLLYIEAVEGVRLIKGTDSPLYVGSVDETVPNKTISAPLQTRWSNNKTFLDIALDIRKTSPFDWLVLRLNTAVLGNTIQNGSLINWLAAPAVALFMGFLTLWLTTRQFIRPKRALFDYFHENKGSYHSNGPEMTLLQREDETGELARLAESMRKELTDQHAKTDATARFLQETPYPLLRCSVNRKVLFANTAARAQDSLFGDDTKEFVSPALSELVRRAFYESKQVYGDIRCTHHAITFRAIPVLDAGYVNLYGERIRRPEDMF